MPTSVPTLAAAGLMSLATVPAAAQVAPAAPDPAAARTAAQRMPGAARLVVASPAFAHGGDIPFENTQYRTNTFPGLSWSAGPEGTKSYVIIMQDTSFVARGAPILHWVMFNIPADVTSLPAGMAPDDKPAGSAYGPNYMGAAKPYTGPRTPPGMKGSYYFSVLALDVLAPEAAAGSYQVLTEAMTGHVLASGEILGMGQADPEAVAGSAAP